MGYKDQTWCTFGTCTAKENCSRFFTEKDKVEAIKWWGNENFPITFFVAPPIECYTEDLK